MNYSEKFGGLTDSDIMTAPEKPISSKEQLDRLAEQLLSDENLSASSKDEGARKLQKEADEIFKNSQIKAIQRAEVEARAEEEIRNIRHEEDAKRIAEVRRRLEEMKEGNTEKVA